MKRINRKKRFPARPGEVKYRKALLPKLKARAAKIVKGLYEAGIIEKFQQYLFTAYPGFGTRSGLNSEVAHAAFDTRADAAALDRLAKAFNAGTLGLDDLTKEMTELMFGAGSQHAFAKLGVKAKWKIDSPATRRAIDTRQNLIKGVDDTQFAAVKDAIRQQVYQLGGGTVDNKFLDKLQAVTGKASQYDAERIARTEVAAVQSEAAHTVYKENGVEQKEWIATNDDRTRDSHADLDGEIVDMEEPFSNGLMYPGDPNGDPGEVINCRCSMAPVTSGFNLDPDEVVTE